MKILLYEKGIPFERCFVKLLTAQDDPVLRAWAATSPRLEVPTLVDGDARIFDSTILVEYLEERFPEPATQPASAAARARVRMLEEVCDTELEAVNWGLMETLRAAAQRSGSAAGHCRIRIGSLSVTVRCNRWFGEPTTHHNEIALDASETGDTRHEAPTLESVTFEQTKTGPVRREDRNCQDFNTERRGMTDGLPEKVCAEASTLIVGMQVDRQVRCDVVTRTLVHKVVESQIPNDATLRRIAVLRNPDRATTANMRCEPTLARSYSNRFEIAATFAGGDREVVDLDDTRQIFDHSISAEKSHCRRASGSLSAVQIALAMKHLHAERRG